VSKITARRIKPGAILPDPARKRITPPSVEGQRANGRLHPCRGTCRAPQLMVTGDALWYFTRHMRERRIGVNYGYSACLFLLERGSSGLNPLDSSAFEQGEKLQVAAFILDSGA